MFQGLNKQEVEDSRQKYGSNIITEAEPETFWQKFLGGFEDPMIRLLLVIAAIMFGLFVFGYAEIYEPIGIAIAILIVTFISSAVVSPTITLNSLLI